MMNRKTKILTLALAAALALGAAACSSGSGSGSGKTTESSAASSADKKTSTDDKDESSASASSDADKESSDADEKSSDIAAEIDLKTADYSSPAVTIEFGQFEEIKKTTEEMQTGKYDGQVIKVTGVSQKRMSSCTVMERDESTGTGYGMTYYLDGHPALSEYPAEDAKVELLGVVTIGDYGIRALTVLPENVKVVE